MKLTRKSTFLLTVALLAGVTAPAVIYAGAANGAVQGSGATKAVSGSGTILTAGTTGKPGPLTAADLSPSRANPRNGEGPGFNGTGEKWWGYARSYTPVLDFAREAIHNPKTNTTKEIPYIFNGTYEVQALGIHALPKDVSHEWFVDGSRQGSAARGIPDSIRVKSGGATKQVQLKVTYMMGGQQITTVTQPFAVPPTK
ncbi:hypothetical protein [Paeniglutamicibacter sp.]|uniref:hypothetical protein n=1 Tax=Paeniglutamicibacter sp. TaxID=1934391 RepID=UPI003989CCBF